MLTVTPLAKSTLQRPRCKSEVNCGKSVAGKWLINDKLLTFPKALPISRHQTKSTLVFYDFYWYYYLVSYLFTCVYYICQCIVVIQQHIHLYELNTTNKNTINKVPKSKRSYNNDCVYNNNNSYNDSGGDNVICDRVTVK